MRMRLCQTQCASKTTSPTNRNRLVMIAEVLSVDVACLVYSLRRLTLRRHPPIVPSQNKYNTSISKPTFSAIITPRPAAVAVAGSGAQAAALTSTHRGVWCRATGSEV